jgi:peptidoglycan L-alanyl-D-glutamate endopeptidase CwlK
MAKLPAPPAEVPVNRRRDGLAPKFDAALSFLLNDLTKVTGVEWMVVETLRNDDRQRFLYGFGRVYDDGRGVVTHSETSDDTWHGYGLAADIVPVKTKWSQVDLFHAIPKLALKRGLLSGADWNRNGASDDERFQDWPHVQWGAMRRSPSPNAARIADKGGLPALWEYLSAA